MSRSLASPNSKILHLSSTSSSSPRSRVHIVSVPHYSSSVTSPRWQPLVIKALQTDVAGLVIADPAIPKDVNQVVSSNDAAVPAPNGVFDFIPGWASWMVGTVFFVLFPFYRKLSNIEDEVEGAVKTIDKVAEMADKVCEEVAEKLPDGNLKDAVLKVEQLSELVCKESELASDLIKKVDGIIHGAETDADNTNGEHTED